MPDHNRSLHAQRKTCRLPSTRRFVMAPMNSLGSVFGFPLLLAPLLCPPGLTHLTGAAEG